MIKKASLLILGLVLMAALLMPGQIVAQGEITVQTSSVTNQFPLRLVFNLKAQSSTDITDVRLCYKIDHIGFADVTSEAIADFTPGTVVQAKWTLEMVQIGGLPPGTSGRYWWRIQDKGGNELTTGSAPFQFNDTRYQWREMSRNNVNLFWYDGDQDSAIALLDSADAGLSKIKNNTGATLNKPVAIYIYASASDLQGSMIYPQEWTGGVTFTRYGIIAIGISQDNMDWGKRAMVHELTHLVINQVTVNPYNGLPIWLNEGLAMNIEGTLEPSFAGFLQQAIDDNSLISVRSLSDPFSAYSNLSYLSYAESYSIVDYLISTYGQAKMLLLLETFHEGSTYDGALQAVYGFDRDGLNRQWRAYVGAGEATLARLSYSEGLSEAANRAATSTVA
jgi:hypothetical protein